MASRKEHPSPPDRIWSELTGFLLVLLGLFLTAALVSFNLNFGLVLGGRAGIALSRLLFPALGFLAYLIPVLVILIGINLFRLASGRVQLFTLLGSLLSAGWLMVSIGYVVGDHRLQLGSSRFARDEICAAELIPALQDPTDSLAAYLRRQFPEELQLKISQNDTRWATYEPLLVPALNQVIQDTRLYDSLRFARILRDRIPGIIRHNRNDVANRELLELAYPRALARKFRFHAAGIAGFYLSRLLVDLIGHAGIITLLIAWGTVLLVVLTPVRRHFGDGLRRLFGTIRKLFTRQPAAKPRLIVSQPAARKEPLPKKEPPAGKELQIPAPPVESQPMEPAPKLKVPPVIPRTIKGKFSFEAQDFLNILHEPTAADQPVKDEAEARQEAESLLGKLQEFGIEGRIENIYSGPLISRFEFIPAPGIKIQRIESLADDLALSLRAERIRILAPIPGKSAVGIEIPNRERKTVYLRTILESETFHNLTSPLGFALGTTITGEPYCADLSTMPHVLIAGTTGSGKSVCINTLVSSIIFRSSYEDVRFLTIDPKRLELPIYDPIPHLLFATTVNSKEAVGRLDYVISVMEHRYRDFARVGARDIAGYNEKAAGKGLRRKPYIVVIIDELADLMITAPSEIEEKITRLAQMSRAVGIHLVLATQRPSVDVITGLIKANFPCRIAFQVASKTDSRTILDMNGAESLLGKGDMLFLPPGKGEPIRLHGAYISAEETQGIVRLLAKRYLAQLLTGLLADELVEPAAEEIVEKDLQNVLSEPGGVAFEERKRRLCSVIPEEIVDTLLRNGYYQKLEENLPLPGTPEAEMAQEEREIDEYFEEAARIVVRHQEASVSMLQRRLDVGWARAGRIIDQLERAGIVGPYVGSKSRKVLVESEAELSSLLARQPRLNLRSIEPSNGAG